MTFPAPDITLDVDPANPGQFFACCGVLELSSRVWPDSEGWFDGAVFHLATSAGGATSALELVVRRIADAKPIVTPASDAAVFDEKVAPLLFVPFGLRLDWWLRPGGSTEADLFKLWSGQQKPATIIEDLHDAFRCIASAPGRRLLWAREAMTGRFGFDPGPAWDSLDVGFSPNEQGVAVLTAPATEILAAVGLQGFRPRREGRSVVYAVWDRPLPTTVARAAASGALGGRRFRFTVVSRGKYKAFGRAREEDMQ